MKRTALFTALIALSAPAFAIDGEILITHAKALAGGVTPGDAPGYPVTLSVAGKYKLGSNLTLPNADTTGVISSVGGISLDLNGFSIVGPAYCPAQGGSEPTPEYVCQPMKSGQGVDLGGPGNSVRNGRIIGVGGYGVYIQNGIVESMDISFVGRSGVVLEGRTGQVRNSSIREAYQSGVLAQANAGVVTNNTIYSSNSLAVTGASVQVIGNHLHGGTSALYCPGYVLYTDNMLGTAMYNSTGTSGGNCIDGGGNLAFNL